MRVKFLAVAFCVFALCAKPALAQPFAKGDVVAFVGDSITHHDRYVRWVADFCATRYPDLGVRVINAGVAGDTAKLSLCRLEDDVTSKRPAVSYVMFGMNDVGWRGVWTANPGPRERASQEKALRIFDEGLRAVVAKLKAADPRMRIVIMTPTPYDDAVRYESAAMPMRDDGLAAAAESARRIARETGSGLVDLHLAMSAFNRIAQSGDDTFSVSGADRVHPGDTDSIFILWCILRTEGVTPYVSRVALDAARGNPFVENAELSDLAVTTNAVEFTLLEKSLPLPIDAKHARVAGKLPLARDLNREILQVSGLAEGEYALSIDGERVGVYAAAALAEGVNLGDNPKTPQYRQALSVVAAGEHRHEHVQFLRNIYWARYCRFKGGKDPDDFDAIRKTIDPAKKYWEARCVQNYVAEHDRGNPTYGKLAAAEAEMRRLGRPVPHRWKLEKTK